MEITLDKKISTLSSYQIMYDKNFLHFILKSKLLTLIFYVVTSVFLQESDFKEVHVTGVVTDKETHKPVPNAEVFLQCEYHIDFENNGYEKKTVFADSLGRYSVTFKRGFNVESAAKSSSHNPYRIYNKLSNDNLTINFELDKIIRNPTLRTLMYVDSFDKMIDEDSPKFPFLRIQIPSLDTTAILDTNNITTYGFDIATMQMNIDTNECDFWFVPGNEDMEPNILSANASGGIFPVYETDINSSFFFELNEAPLTGYRNKIYLNGKEEGFFVRARDKKTFAKIILHKWKIDSSGPGKNGKYKKEYGKNFSCVVQTNGTRNLHFSREQLDLSEFVIDGR
ncbi:MAG: hypothetical protein J0M18_05405 [Ignavibacteria bacterium]|nr:hypothetical protein [Ignavibacteria bacterium]